MNSEEDREILSIDDQVPDSLFSFSPIPSPIYSQPNYSQSQIQSQTLYSGLLNPPEVGTFDPSVKYCREVGKVYADPGSAYYSITDFLTHGPKPRPSRKVRKNCTDSSKFTSRQGRTFTRRLEAYRPLLESRIADNTDWASVRRIPNILDLSTLNSDPECQARAYAWDNSQGLGFVDYWESIVMIGYIIKVDHPNEEYHTRLCKEISVIPAPLKSTHGKEDKLPYLYLEDETCRIRLDVSTEPIEAIQRRRIVSGVPVAVKGASIRGQITVEDIIYPTPDPPEWPLFQDEAIEMVFVSGLHFGSPDLKISYLDLLLDYLQGLCGSAVEQEKILVPRTRVFFVGNVFSKRPTWNDNIGESLAIAHSDIVQRLDTLLESLAQTMEVFIVPGENDPTHQGFIPQPCVHRQLFPESSQRPTFHRLTNPAKISLSLFSPTNFPSDENLVLIDDPKLDVVLTSGKNVRDTMQLCDIKCPLDACRKLLEWSHLNPSSVADNELAENIFSLSGTLPHLLVVGGLSEFKVEDYNGVKIIGIPSFLKTQTIAVFTKRGKIMPIKFNVSL